DDRVAATALVGGGDRQGPAGQVASARAVVVHNVERPGAIGIAADEGGQGGAVGAGRRPRVGRISGAVGGRVVSGGDTLAGVPHRDGRGVIEGERDVVNVPGSTGV